MADVAIRNLVRRFGSYTALDQISFDVHEGEFLTLLGPSGCGKSTTLAALAGLDRPTSGRIDIGGRTVFDSTTGVFIDAQFRELGMMFQSYALWPHMTVAQNLAFPLELRGIKGADARRRIVETLDLVDMGAMHDRYPGELSGGQQQRVALARTLVYSPRILLLDEPLSNLDAKLRERARSWLRDLQRRTGVTTVYVTHDQTEALGLSDRIIVMNTGRIAQIGTPREIYDAPEDVFVAEFVGTTNLLQAQIVEGKEQSGQIRLRCGTVCGTRSSVPGRRGTVLAAIRPEKVQILDRPDDSGDAANTVRGHVIGTEYQGGMTLVTVDIGGETLRVESRVDVASDRVTLHLPAESLSILPAS